MPVLSLGKSSSTFSVGIGTSASASQDLLTTNYPTRFYIPDGPTSFTHTVDKTKPLHDYVAQWAESGDWVYRIWASGKKEMWFRKEVTLTSFTAAYTNTSGPSSGRLYVKTYSVGNFPVAFTSAPRVIMLSNDEPANTEPAVTYVGNVTGITATSGGSAMVCRSGSTTSLTTTICIYYVGDD